MPNFSDLMDNSQHESQNVVSTLGMGDHPFLGMAAWLALGHAEKRFTDPKRFASIYTDLGMRMWMGNGLLRGRMGMGPLTGNTARRLGTINVHRFMQSRGWSNLGEMARNMTAASIDPGLARAARGGWARETALHRGLERRFGKKFASRMMLGRALGSASTAANLFFMAEIGGAAGQFVGSLISSWRPSPGKPEARRSLETGGNWVDTRIAYTQRQRAIQAIHNSMLTSRAALGNEASFMHG